MKKIDADAAAAFKHCRKFTRGATRVRVEDGVATLILHGNPIARFDPSKHVLAMTMHGWGTVTTRARLNAVCRLFRLGGFGFRQSRSMQYYGDRVIDANDIIQVDLAAHEGRITTAQGEPVQPTQTPEQAAQVPLFA